MMLNMENYIDTVSQPACCLGITGASHVPFKHGQKYPKHRTENMPANMSAYLNCLTFTDSCIGHLVQHVYSHEATKNTTIVITGDHTVFRTEYKDINEYARMNNYAFRTPKTCTPLIIYSPHIEKNSYVTDTCYQMDIYPTILSVLGLEDYYWYGVGANLTDSISFSNRQINEGDAYEYSDWLIRSNYFVKYKEN